MKKLGEGWQYSVYNLGNGRVLKKYHHWLSSAWVMFKDLLNEKEHSIFEIPSFIVDLDGKAKESIKIIGRRTIPMSWLGNPKFLNDLDYEQDKVIPLHAVFESSTTAQINEIIDVVLDFNKELLARGVIDKSFNITKNYGLDKKSKIVLIDFGELYDEPANIRKQLTKKIWHKSYVGGYIKDLDARKYFLEKMDEFAKLYL
ncbi:hypothetical protein A3B18_02025 [Candidatus Giovannonibacteria bacterium RIFCSPLOWO2_01_FULL_46_13]|uniref:Uncharacterized protein n=1 Tax=Candidatus Giovannonibacteria bacterium RIFCSPLOWO2_01_FULL_46_13 TaxID=1798352 RepID=A0A1F5X710_9BACT|nr:MAG: hypothetical protein A3B18_02025 [Candidatus Giovannonibacteria bacterium RIFCSPLOWO2_01_FULL_46_13]